MKLFDAIYTRQSVDRVDSISVESQVEFCKREVVDEHPIKVYTDKGYSGKNIDRPAFQELLRDIEAGTIRRVVVYRLDRISRSVLDFAGVIEVFQKYGMGCLGCAAARFENLEAGARVHGFDPDQMVADINALIGE